MAGVRGSRSVSMLGHRSLRMFPSNYHHQPHNNHGWIGLLFKRHIVCNSNRSDISVWNSPKYCRHYSQIQSLQRQRQQRHDNHAKFSQVVRSYSSDKQQQEQQQRYLSADTTGNTTVEWDMIKQDVALLRRETDFTVSSLANSNNNYTKIVELMKQWHYLLKRMNHPSILTRSSINTKKKHNNNSDESLKVLCAQQMDQLLDRYVELLLSDNNNIDNNNDGARQFPSSLAFELALNGWKDSGSSTLAGDGAASVLDKWGEIYGGNIDLSPTIDAFNIVLDAYSQCNLVDWHNNNNNNTNNTNSYPANQAWEIGNLLVLAAADGNISLSPNMESFSHLIHSLAQHAIYNMTQETNDNKDDNYDTISSRVAATRAYHAWEKMLQCCDNDTKSSTSLNNQFLELRAYTDILTLFYHGLLSNLESNDDDTDVATNKNEMHSIMTNSVSQMEQLIQKLALQAQNNNDDYSNETPKINDLLEDACLVTLNAHLYLQQQEQSDNHLIENCIDSALQMEQFLSSMMDKAMPNPHYNHFQMVITAYSNIFSNIKNNHININDDEIKNYYHDILSTHQIHEKSMNLLKQMEQTVLLPNNRNRDEPCDGFIYGSVIWIWLQSLRYNRLLQQQQQYGVDKILSILDRMLYLHQQGNVVFPVAKHVTNAFNNVFLALYENSSTNKAYEVTNRLFPIIERGLPTTTNSIVVTPDAVTYRFYLSILSRMGGNQAANQAFSLFHSLKQLSSKTKAQIPINAMHYSLVIKALSQSTDRNAASKAHNLLIELEALDENNRNCHNSDDVTTFQADAILYTSVITSYSRNKTNNLAAQKAEELLQKLEGRYMETLDERFKPDIVAYSSVLNAFANQSKEKDSLYKAERLLERIESKYLGGDKHMLPNKICYTTVLFALARSRSVENARKSEDIFARMERMYEHSGGEEELKPDSQTYSAVIDAWAKSSSHLAAERAEHWLAMMEEKTKTGDFAAKPNTRTYTNVINALRFGKDENIGNRAENILKMMEEKYAKGDLEAAPDVITYSSVISVWARSNSPQKAKHAWEILKRMEEKGLKPSTITFTAVMNACEHTRGDKKNKAEALRIFLEVLNCMQKSDDAKPNQFTFRTMLSTVGRLVVNDSQRKNHLISKIFELCCEAGYVDEIILKQIKKFSPFLFHKLPKKYCESGKISNLPEKWTRHSQFKINN